MSSPRHDSTQQFAADERARRLDEAIADYLRACDAGRSPPRQEFLAAHPDLADDLNDFLTRRAAIERAAAPFRAILAAGPAPSLRSTVRYFGDYELLDEIGAGGMGVIFKARQASLDRYVALKMIREGRFADDRDSQRFRAEAEAAAALDHPHITPIHEVGMHEGRHYFTMKLVTGEDLHRRLAAGPLAVREAAVLVATVARAVHYAHQRGILHRDLKPSNILLDETGKPYVADFGLARRLDRESSLTQTGAVLGTPSYMAPEQAGGNDRSVTVATDVYGLGAILYASLTGKPPFEGDSAAAILRSVQEHEPPSPGKLRPRLDRDLETICLKCLEKDAQRRYGSADALADDLDRWLRGEPINARRSGPVERAIKWARRRPAVAALLGAVSVLLLLLVCGLAVSNVLVRGALAERTSALRRVSAAERKSRDALAAKSVALEERTGALVQLRESEGKTRQALLRESKTVAELSTAHATLQAQSRRLEEQQRSLFRSLLKLACAQALGNDVALADANLESFPQELRGWEWRYAKRLCRPELLSLPGNRKAVFVGSGELLAASSANVINVFRLPEGTQTDSLKGPTDSVACLAASRDGAWIASAGSDKTVRIWNVATGQQVFDVALPATPNDLAFRPDGRHVAAAADDGALYVLDVTSGQITSRLSDAKTALLSVAYSPDGKWLAAGAALDATLTLWSADSGERICRLERLIDVLAGLEGEVNGSVADLCFAPEGNFLAAATGDLVVLVDVSERQVVQTFAGHIGGVLGVAFSPHGNALASASSDGTIKIWSRSTGQSMRTLPWHQDSVRSLDFSPDGRQLATSAADEVKLWDVSTDWEVRRLPIHTDAAYGLSFSADGRLLASAGGRYRRLPDGPERPGEVRVIDLASQRTVFQIDFPRPAGFRFGALAVALSPNGKLVAAGGCDRAVRVWDIAAAKQILELTDIGGEVRSLEFSRDGAVLAAGALSTIAVWQVSSGDLLHTFPGAYAAFSPQGDRLFTCGDSLSAWDLASKKQLYSQPLSPRAWRLAMSPDGKQLGLSLDTRNLPLERRDEFLQIRSAATGESTRTLKSTIKRDYAKDDYVTGVYGVSFSADNQRIASAGGDKTVRLWDVETGDELLVFAHPNQVFCVAFSPDGRRLASGSGHWCGPRPGEVSIWDALPEAMSQAAEEKDSAP